MMSRAHSPFDRSTATPATSTRSGSTRGGRSQLDWPILFRCLAEHTDYEERLDGLLEAISTGTGLPVVALYLADDPESRFHLVRLRRPLSEEKPPPAKSRGRVAFLGGALGGHFGREEADVLAYEVDEKANPDSVTAIVASPPLDLPRREEYTIPRLVSTPLGALYSVPLMREARSARFQRRRATGRAGRHHPGGTHGGRTRTASAPATRSAGPSAGPRRRPGP